MKAVIIYHSYQKECRKMNKIKDQKWERLHGKRRIHNYADSQGKNLYDTLSPLLPEDSELTFYLQ